MMMNPMWFGEPWPTSEHRAPVCEDDSKRVPTPVGKDCGLCGQGVSREDRGVMIPHLCAREGWEVRPIHVDCLLHNVIGNRW